MFKPKLCVFVIAACIDGYKLQVPYNTTVNPSSSDPNVFVQVNDFSPGVAVKEIPQENEHDEVYVSVSLVDLKVSCTLY